MINNKLIVWVMVLGIIMVSFMGGFYISTATAFPQNPSTYTYFEKICNQPHEYHKTYVSSEYFWTYGGDCDERAREFKLYLENKGARNVQIIKARNIQNGKIAPDPKGSYGHTFLLWDGRVYNPSLNKTVRQYGTSLDDYKELLKSDYYGLNTLYYENGTVESL